MALIIDDAETEELVRQLAEAMGVSEAETVRIAVEEKLQRVRRLNAIQEIVANIHRLGGILPEGVDSTTATDFLYDENGLPK
jgi:hypothetical protein